MKNLEPIIFTDADVTPVEVPVTIGKNNYVLQEASGDAATRFRNHNSRCSKYVDGKFAGIDGPLADGEAMLVSLCLYRLQENDRGQTVRSQVPEKDVRAWPAKVQTALFDRIKQISELDTGPETAEEIKRQIDFLQKKLKALEEHKETLKNA